jgi:hypothetical protein
VVQSWGGDLERGGFAKLSVVVVVVDFIFLGWVILIFPWSSSWRWRRF